MVQVIVNGAPYDLEVDPSTPLLWVLRDALGLTATRYGCGIGQCGACTVHVDGEAVRSCLRAVGTLDGAEVMTLEGLDSAEGRALREAWLRLQVPQCGYCQGGVIMACAALLARSPQPSDEQVAEAITNLCRCGTYLRIRRGIHEAAEQLQRERAG